MGANDDSFPGLTFEPGLDQWQGEGEIAAWGATLPVSIEATSDGPSARQRAVLESILAFQGDFRPEVEGIVYDHYKDTVEGTTGYFERGVDVTAKVAPRLESPHEIWRLLHSFALFIPALRAGPTEVVFEMHMECSWDRDHGLCVLFRDWSAQQVAGQTDCRGSDL